jgi:hypothetical protein
MLVRTRDKDKVLLSILSDDPVVDSYLLLNRVS